MRCRPNTDPVPENYRAEGERVYIRPIMPEDTDILLSWRNSEYVVKNFFYRKPISVEDHLSWLENKVNKGLVYQFIVCVKETDEPIGCVYFQGYEEVDNSMESGLFMSPNTPKGSGYATESYKLLLFDFGRDVCGLTKAKARILKSNGASIRVHEKTGFVIDSESTIKLVPGGEEVSAVSMVCDLTE